MHFRVFSTGCALCASLAAFSAPAFADATKDIEILSPGSLGASQAALEVLKRAVATKGYLWKEIVAEGGSGGMVSAVSTSTPAPVGALLNGFDILSLAKADKLGDVTATALKDAWVRRLPDPLLRFLVVRGKWVAAPIDITPVNGLWVNAALMNKIGGLQPNTFDDFIALLDKAKESGVDALTIGSDPREQAALFDDIIVATAGADFYKRVFGDIRETDIKSDVMKRAFDDLARLRDQYVDSADARRDPNTATQMVVRGEALAHAGAGPTRLAFAAAGKTGGTDYRCYRFPGTDASVLYTLDLIAMPNVEPSRRAAQAELAATAMDTQVQSDISVAKAAVPASGVVPDPGDDACATLDYDSVKQAMVTGQFYGSMAYAYMQPPAIASAYVDVVSRFYRGEIKTSEEAMAALFVALSTTK